ncbi:histidinol-phosphatase HisJ family protein [Olsenella massiliensis]|uniref:histidinol-phosphatase HisJ family protein n=1 Tax=Olsenella massiliensis TaxID=1622075 RepID=UPI00071D21D0|nr:histidinol-phosphatase HisJ family protein [Olsenella massiliensis]
MLRANYHTHTVLCDGANTAEQMVRRALDLGFEHLGFSGHMDPDIHMDWPAYVSEIDRLKRAYGERIDILTGVELDNTFDRSCCPGAEYVIGSTHFLPVATETPMSVDGSPETLRRLCDEFYGGDWYRLTRAYYEFEAQVHERTDCTFVGHFDLVTRFNDQMRAFDEGDPRYLAPALEAMERLVSEGVPFEINCGAVNRGRKRELYPRHELLRALNDMGGQILINADAHQAEKLDGGFDVAVRTALACGFTHVNILAHEPDGTVGLRQLALDAL